MHDINFNATFKETNNTKKRYRVLMGGAGSGKSVNTAQDYILKLSNPKYAGCSLMVIRAAESDHLNSTFAELYGAIVRMGLEHVWSVKTTPLLMVNNQTRNYIIFRGCNDQRARARIKSITVPEGKICWIWAEEATELEADDFEILDDRLRGKLPDGFFYQFTLTFNPVSSTHWIKKRLWDFDDSNTFKHHSTYLDNKFIDNGEISLFSGVVRCADCGTKMTYNRKVYQTYTKEYYRCGRYTNQGTDACSPHTILQEKIYDTVISDIRNYVKLAYSDEQQLIDRLTKDNAKHNAKLSQRIEKQIAHKEYRLSEIDSLIQSLFEEKISGTVPENIFKRMAKKYDDEQLAIVDELERLKSELAELWRDESDISSWVTKIRRCLSIESLTREIIVELIDSITVSDVYEIDGEPQQDINIVYRFENISAKGKRAS